VTPPIEAVAALSAGGSEWSIAPIAPPAGAGGAAVDGAGASGGGEGFGSMLADAVGELQQTQDAAAEQARALATGQTQDVASVVSTVEQARMSMELAGQLRNKAVEAYTDIFRTQV
jgi:flagellar hook-basal body complex protein FliE